MFHGFKPSRLSRWTNRDFQRHQEFNETFFFAGANEFEKKQTLVNIDIDCKEFGTLNGATAFAKWIRKNIFPNMYFEVSTNGNGIHGYIILDKGELGSEAVNRLLLNRLDKFLKLCLAETDFDVENVEIKGTLPTFCWGNQKYDLKEYKSGVLAKFPRLGSKKKEKALRETTHLSVTDLQDFELSKLLKRSGIKISNRQSSNSSVGHSSSGIPISKEELSSLKDHVAVAEQILDGKQLSTSSRHVVNSTDVAIFLMLGKCFTENMNKDGSMPSERFSSVWTKMHENGDVDRGYNGKRVKAIRDFLTSQGLICWVDNHFVIGTELDEQGNRIKGKACKWHFADELMELLDLSLLQSSYGEGESIFRDTIKKQWKNQGLPIDMGIAQTFKPTVPTLVTANFEFNVMTQRLYDAPEQFLRQAA